METLVACLLKDAADTITIFDFMYNSFHPTIHSADEATGSDHTHA
jgi:hypothetical protein